MTNGRGKGERGNVKTENAPFFAPRSPFFAHLLPLSFCRPLRCFAPPRPNLGEESGRGLTFWFQVLGFMFYVPIHFVPLSQGAKRVFIGMTECHSVPSEGSTPQCDVGQSP